MNAWSKVVVFFAVLRLAATYDNDVFNRRCERLAAYIQRTESKDHSA